MALLLTLDTSAQAQTMSKDEYQNGKTKVEADYKTAEAKGNKKTALAALEARADAKQTAAEAADKAQEKVLNARSDASANKADAQYKVEKEKCDALAGAAKDN